jgi:hypothetical protein
MEELLIDDVLGLIIEMVPQPQELRRVNRQWRRVIERILYRRRMYLMVYDSDVAESTSYPLLHIGFQTNLCSYRDVKLRAESVIYSTSATCRMMPDPAIVRRLVGWMMVPGARLLTYLQICMEGLENKVDVIRDIAQLPNLKELTIRDISVGQRRHKYDLSVLSECAKLESLKLYSLPVATLGGVRLNVLQMTNCKLDVTSEVLRPSIKQLSILYRFNPSVDGPREVCRWVGGITELEILEITADIRFRVEELRGLTRLREFRGSLENGDYSNMPWKVALILYTRPENVILPKGCGAFYLMR